MFCSSEGGGGGCASPAKYALSCSRFPIHARCKRPVYRKQSVFPFWRNEIDSLYGWILSVKSETHFKVCCRDWNTLTVRCLHTPTAPQTQASVHSSPQRAIHRFGSALAGFQRFSWSTVLISCKITVRVDGYEYIKLLVLNRFVR